MWGVSFILIGIALFGKFTGLFNILFNGWWTILIIAPATFDFFTTKHKLFSLCSISVGVSLLLQQIGIIKWDMMGKVLMSFFIAIIGIKLLFFRSEKNLNFSFPMDLITDHSEIYTAILSGNEVKCDHAKFSKARLNVIFGGITLDLTKALIEEDIYIYVYAVFGGCTIILPDNIKVQTTGANILGGVDNKVQGFNIDAKTVYIKYNVVFSGISIKNAN